MTVYCINPNCPNRKNPSSLENCQSCGTPLSIKHRYRLLFPLKRIDCGSYSEVFEVEDLGVQAVQGERYKIMKILKRNNKKLVHLFRQEAEVLKELKHPGIPQIALEDGYFTFAIPHRRRPLHCLVMEKVEGINLQTWVEKNGVISEKQALEWLMQVLKILDYLHHGKYLIHRDIKPSNIMLHPSGQLKLIDFGTVKRITETYLIRIGIAEEGTLICSSGYTPDEIVSEGKAFPQSDFYSLGRTLVYLLTGIIPFNLTEESGQLNWKKTLPSLSPNLGSWIDYLMVFDPFYRPPSTSWILNQLEGKTVEDLPPPPMKNPPRIEPPNAIVSPWLVRFNFALFCILLVTGSFWWQSKQENPLNMVRQEKSLTQIESN